MDNIYGDFLSRLYKHVKRNESKYVCAHDKIIHAFQHLKEQLSKEQQQIEDLHTFALNDMYVLGEQQSMKDKKL